MDELTTFSNICNRIYSIVISRKNISEETLLDFNKFVIIIIKNNITNFPDSFYELSNCISDYWHYEISKEIDPNKKYLYIRLYQMINTITFYSELNYQEKIFKELDKQKQNINLICLIHDYPGITYKALSAKLSISSKNLYDLFEELRLNKFLHTWHSFGDCYCMLSNLGDKLYEELIKIK